MRYSVNPAMAATDAPPVMEARRWLDGVVFPPDRPLINVSQAAPVAPPPEGLRAELARVVVEEDAAHLYGPVLGLPALREEVAAQWSAAYGGQIAAAQVAIASGCNQAFTAALSALAGVGDAVLIPVPWYFNHAMHCSMAGVRAVPVPTGDDLMPDPAAAEALVGRRTRAIVLVSPNNPGGVEYPATLVRAFFDLAQRHGLALLLDETYRDFDSRPGAPHDLFADPDWDATLVHLYSFSKAFRLTGHRVGALLAAPALLREVEKYLDTVTICPNQIGQRAALWGLRNLGQWVAGERAEILDRRAAVVDAVAGMPGWQLRGCGAYFAWVAHPFDLSSPALARRLVSEAGVLLLPGTMFRPASGPASGGAGSGGEQELRIAFANVDRAGIGALAARLGAWRP